jgi:hypothetical protein
MFFFWVLAPCRLVGKCQRFGETYCLHLQPWRWRQYVSPKRCHIPVNVHVLSLSLGLKMETVCFSETLSSTYECTCTVSIFRAEDGDSMFLRNVVIYLWMYMYCLHFQGWRWRQYVSPKRCHLPTNVHVLSPSSGLKMETMFLRKVVIYLRMYTAPKPRRTTSSSPPWQPQMLHEASLIQINKLQLFSRF